MLSTKEDLTRLNISFLITWKTSQITPHHDRKSISATFLRKQVCGDYSSQKQDNCDTYSRWWNWSWNRRFCTKVRILHIHCVWSILSVFMFVVWISPSLKFAELFMTWPSTSYISFRIIPLWNNLSNLDANCLNFQLLFDFILTLDV